jgi:glycosyltransferase involved in cell wall biosynthesis
MGDATVSTIITTKNSARTLGPCLASIARQTYPAIELILVDNHSTDSTRSIAADYGASILTIGPERSAQRNYGAGRATGEYLLFIDSDMVLEAAVVEECVAASRDGAEAVVIPESSFGEGFWARCKRLERRCYAGDDDIEAARFYTRSLFSSLGGFDEQLSGPEDWDLHMRARGLHASLARTNAVIHHDEGDLRLSRLLAKKYRYGKSFPAYRKKHRGLANRQLRVIRPAFVRNRAVLIDEPFVLAGILLMKSLEFAAGAAGALSVVAARRRPVSGV